MSADPSSHTAGPMSLPGGAVTRRTRPIYRVFVSSTWLDLQPERRALMEALNRMEEMRFVGMEFFGNRPDDTHDASIDQVNLCEVFVGIIGHRYGSGITEAEYRRARELNLPCFVYFKREETARPELTDNDPALAAKLAAFKQDLLRGHTVKEFAGAEELAASATADLHNWVAARWISMEPVEPAVRTAGEPVDADRTNILRLLERIDHDWIKGVLESSLHHRAWLELGLNWREDAIEHPWDRIVVSANRPIQTLGRKDSIAVVFDAAHQTLLVLGEPGAGKTTTVLELARDLISRARASPAASAPVILALSTWRGEHRDFLDWLIAELGLRYQVPRRVARSWLEEGRLVLILDGLDEVVAGRREACVAGINAFAQVHPPAGLAVTCRVAEYDALSVKLRLRAAICLQPLTSEQVDRYFEAAGRGLQPLRQALREDAGLRDLARSPLMLSVMTMAWRNAPAETTAPFAATQTPEELRRRLFEAYVQAALRRRGKASGGYAPEQVINWLAWLARCMKAHGQTLFAVEQLQPAWLANTGLQLGYFLVTRLLGSLALMLPLLLWSLPVKSKLIVAGLAVTLGVLVGMVDFGFARRRWGGLRTASFRFFTLFFTFTLVGIAGVIAMTHYSVMGSLSQPVMIYWAMAGFAFCAPLDVGALDVKPSAGMRWSWRQACDRGLMGLVAMNVALLFIFVAMFGFVIAAQGLKSATPGLGDPWFWTGFLVAMATAIGGWMRFRPRRSARTVGLTFLWLSLGGQIGAALGHPREITAWGIILIELVPAVGIGVFGGFAPMLIDPTRGRNGGVWFWLRVPVLMLVFVGGLMTIPGLVWIFSAASQSGQTVTADQIGMAIAVGAMCGLVAFFRFGGFNGLQHGVLRWLLLRSGHLPPKPGQFLDRAAQLALLQKVGFGYRFIHALLLDHLAESRGGPGK